MLSTYNGYAGPERMAKFREMQRRIAAKTLDEPEGPCRLCNDPGESDSDVTFEYHDEDYSQDYRWSEPYAYVLCRDCHIYRIHQRFRYPLAWQTFLAHVRRGGYAREMRNPVIKAELAALRASTAHAGVPSTLTQLRTYPGAWRRR